MLKLLDPRSRKPTRRDKAIGTCRVRIVYYRRAIRCAHIFIVGTGRRGRG